MANVLLIEDDDLMRAMIATALRFNGHTVIEARDGQEGLARYAAGLGHFELVVCDLILPQRGGVNLIRALRKHSPDCRILLISGAHDALRAIRALPDLGQPIDGLEKPFPVPRLLETVEQLLAGNDAATPEAFGFATG